MTSLGCADEADAGRAEASDAAEAGRTVNPDRSAGATPAQGATVSRTPVTPTMETATPNTVSQRPVVATASGSIRVSPIDDDPAMEAEGDGGPIGEPIDEREGTCEDIKGPAMSCPVLGEQARNDYPLAAEIADACTEWKFARPAEYEMVIEIDDQGPQAQAKAAIARVCGETVAKAADADTGEELDPASVPVVEQVFHELVGAAMDAEERLPHGGRVRRGQRARVGHLRGLRR